MPDHQDTSLRVARQRHEPVVLTLESLTQRAVDRMRTMLQGIPPERPVIIDVTTLAGFDSQGTSALQDLQDEAGEGRLLVVGFRQAAARLFELNAILTEPTKDDDGEATLRVLPTPGMVFVDIKSATSRQALDSLLRSAIARDIAIVVVDLESVTIASIDVLLAVTAASHAAAAQGHELVLINVADDLASLLDRVGLAATTYLAAAR